MLRSSLLVARSRASLLFVGALLCGCGGASAPPGDYKLEEGPQGGLKQGGSPIASASPTASLETPPADPSGFMRVGDVARETLTTTVPAATAAPDVSKPIPDIKTTKNIKSVPTSIPARAGNPPPPPAGEHKPDTDAGASTPHDEQQGVHAAVVDSASNLSEAEVRTTIVQKQASFRECYDLGVSSSAGFSGTVALRIAIGPTGTVASVEVLSSTTKVAAVDSCVTQAVRRIQFPAKGNGAVVGFPIEFGR